MERRLAAILAADAVGHGRLSRVGEESTPRLLGAYIDADTALIDRCSGKVVRIASDAALADEAMQ